MPRSPAVNGLIIVIVIVLVAGVGWFKAQHREAATAGAESTTVFPPQSDPTPLPGRDATEVAQPKPERLPQPDAVAQSEAPTPTEPEAAESAPPDTSSPPRSAAAEPSPLDAPVERPARDDEPQSEPQPASERTDPTITSTPKSAPASQPIAAKLPRVVDLGADKCKACKELAPILEELKKEYAGRVTVEFIDVWKNPKAGGPYKLRIIPTQVFFDRDGKEVWRHEGFLPKKDFVAKFAELGVK
jgi:thioredoxin 1